MTSTELLSLQKPVTRVLPDEVPADLLERAAAYNDAVTVFREAVRDALADLQQGHTIDPETADGLRTCAAGLVTAREWLLDVARLPSARRPRRV